MAEHYPITPQVVDPVETRSDLTDTSELETSNSRLGEIKHVPVNVPHYATCQPAIAVTMKIVSIGETHCPHCVAIHEGTHEIFVANGNDRVRIFSETGDYLYLLGVEQLYQPYGIAIHGDSVYVSCLDNTVSKFSLTEMCHVRMIGGEGSNNGQFDNPGQLMTDPIGHVFITDTGNSRICIYDPDLNHIRNITHQCISAPCDVKISHDRLYVLCPNSNPCIQVLTLEGDKLHSLIACGEGKNDPIYLVFCLDPLNNFVISDFRSHSIRVFSPEGNLLHTIGREGDQPGMFRGPKGVAITPNGRLVCVSFSIYYGLQIFY